MLWNRLLLTSFVSHRLAFSSRNYSAFSVHMHTVSRRSGKVLRGLSREIWKIKHQDAGVLKQRNQQWAYLSGSFGKLHSQLRNSASEPQNDSLLLTNIRGGDVCIDWFKRKSVFSNLIGFLYAIGENLSPRERQRRAQNALNVKRNAQAQKPANAKLKEEKQDQENSDENKTPPNNDPEKQDRKGDGRDPLAALLLWLGLLGMLAYLAEPKKMEKTEDGIQPRGRKEREISWSEFTENLLKKGEIEEVTVWSGGDDRSQNEGQPQYLIRVTVHPGAIVNKIPAHGNHMERTFFLYENDIKRFENNVRSIEKELGIPIEHSLSINYRNLRLLQAVYYVSAMFVVFGIVRLLFISMKKSVQGANPFEMFTKAAYTRGDLSNKNQPKIRFSDIAGMTQAKIEVKEYVEYLKNPVRFQKLGAQIPCGALLLGPPGCGKTLLAKAVAAESEVPFLVMAGSDFVEVVGGLGAARVRQLFKEARGMKPCIIYIDEIDALGRSRSTSGSTFSSSESEHTLNQLLAEMDGMTDNAGVIVLASTNRADVLDKALLRPGRFDRHITIDFPTLSERKELFEMYIKKLNITKQADTFSSQLAQATPMMSGADIANICNEAALHAARIGNKTVEADDFAYAVERITVGQEKLNSTLSIAERKRIAYHECGHVLTSWLLRKTDKLLKVSIVPRTGATMGFSRFMPSDRKLYSQEELFEMMVVALGGRAAEAIVFNSITNGAANDLKKVTDLAYSQIKTYGMNENIGLLSFPSKAEEEFMMKPYSKHLQRLMDSEANVLVTKAYRTAEKLLTDNREKLDKLSKKLLEQEVLSHEEVKSLIGAPPHGEKTLRESYTEIEMVQ